MLAECTNPYWQCCAVFGAVTMPTWPCTERNGASVHCTVCEFIIMTIKYCTIGTMLHQLIGPVNRLYVCVCVYNSSYNL